MLDICWVVCWQRVLLGLYAVPYTVYGRIGMGGVRLRNSRTRNRTVRFLRTNGYGTAVLTAYDRKNGIRNVNFELNRHSS